MIKKNQKGMVSNMKIVYVCLCGLYMDGWGYQDNLLAKYHVRLGHEVTVITSNWVYSHEGEYIRTDKTEETDRNGVKIRRIPIKGNHNFTYKIKRYTGLYEKLEEEKPDLIFVHSSQFLDAKQIAEYAKKHPGIKIYVDNHCDYSNSATNWLSKNILHRILWRRSAKLLEPYTEKFYGVLPARVDFMRELYGIREDKLALLVMGADDEKVEEAAHEEVKENIRQKLSVKKEDFLIVTGGKIDHAKKQTLLLMDAVQQMNRENVKLVVFGSIVDDLRDEVLKRCTKDGRIQYIGWLNSDDTYPYFAAADLVVFPGRHSVMWEQVVAQGIPMICKYWDGTTHVDLGGNVHFLYEDSTEEIVRELTAVMDDSELYGKMQDVARTKGMQEFSYREIAKRAIGENRI